jgi:Flp pilus assembly protein TadG
MRRRLPALARRLADTAGTNLVEAAIITPLLLLLTMAIVDLASMFYVYLALENGVSQASRYAVTGNVMPDPDDPGSTLSRTDSIKAAMRDATPSLTIEDGAFTFTHLSPGSGTWASGVGGPSDIDKVEVRYSWSLMTPLMRPFFPGGQVDFVVDSAMKNEARFE